MLKTLGTAAARHKWWFFGGWIALIVGLIVASSALPGETQNDFTIPGTESQQAEDLLTEEFPQFVNANVKVVYQTTDGSELTSSSNASAIESAVDALEQVDGVSTVTDPTKTPQDLIALSSDKTIGFSTVTFDTVLADVSDDAFDNIEAAAQPAVTAGLNVQFSGTLIDIQDPVPPGISEYADEIGLGLAAIILLLSFGSVVAMGLPLGTALFALIVSATTLTILEYFVTIGGINVTFGTMIGLGVGVDYSLLILNRYLQDRAEGDDVVTAAGAAVNTAGRAVLFAGITISIAVVALTVFSVPYLSTLGLTSAMFVMFTVLAALTLLPAFIGMAGKHIESIRLPFIKKRSEVDPADPCCGHVGHGEPVVQQAPSARDGGSVGNKAGTHPGRVTRQAPDRAAYDALRLGRQPVEGARDLGPTLAFEGEVVDIRPRDALGFRRRSEGEQGERGGEVHVLILSDQHHLRARPPCLRSEVDLQAGREVTGRAVPEPGLEVPGGAGVDDAPVRRGCR